MRDLSNKEKNIIKIISKGNVHISDLFDFGNFSGYIIKYQIAQNLENYSVEFYNNNYRTKPDIYSQRNITIAIIALITAIFIGLISIFLQIRLDNWCVWE